ncbi:XrtA/PEP-CTERM system TPR-repeat protein PrsT [Methylocaldum sp.]|uniref:XrtA/PEP-CTERM system TPR-repeat protein PrsT n=1 Tax=Methylocaldum sp. TaxID=1969727 RepID=UPI002D41655C|nr:XrtA/PEP-CTERM system TPR-repeat protein PrsT [Methylocaldum sp.]HYE34456.1 XrtA/PEP-CTERM system TPR-repeat protein PrsT [Methylocaldum sp.]
MKAFRPFFRSALFSLIALWIVPVESAPPDTAAGYYEDALLHYQKADHKAAIIQLKNALQLDRDFLPAHVLLGEVYIKEGNAPAAAEEFKKADRLGADRSVTIVGLAKAYLLQGKYVEVLSEIDPKGLPRHAQAEVLARRGYAHLELRDKEKAEQAFTEADALNPSSAAPKTGLATLNLRNGSLDRAEEFATEAIRLAPNDPEAWNAKASVSHAKGATDQAVGEYAQLISLQPNHLEGRLAHAGLLLDLNRIDEAQADFDYFKQHFPAEPRSTYLSSIWLARKGAPEAAREDLERAAAVVDGLKSELTTTDGQFLLVGGMAHAGLHQPEKAREYLTRYIALNPGNFPVSLILGSVLLEQKDYNGVVNLLSPFLKHEPDNPRLLALLGSAYMRKGWHQEATDLLTKAASISGGNPEIRTELALTHLGTGDQAAAIRELQSVTTAVPDMEPAGLALVLLHLKRGEYAQAIEAAQKLSAQQPNNPTLLNILGSAEMAARDYSSARRHFEQASAIDGKFLAPRLNLGKLDLLGGNVAKAEERFQAILRERPADIQTMIELARLEETKGEIDQAILWLEKARATSKKHIPARIYLTNLYLRNKNTAKALEVAEETASANPDSHEALLTSARANLANGDKNAARIVLDKLSRIAGSDPSRVLDIAELQLAAEDSGGAAWSLVSALKRNPEFLPAQIRLAQIRLLRGELEQAEDGAEALRKTLAKHAVGDILLGDIRMRQGRFGEAAASYRAALDKEPSGPVAIRLYESAAAGGESQGTMKILQDWISAHPDDTLVRQALAESLHKLGKLPEARKQYELILSHRTEDPVLLNNLAFLYWQLDEPAALDFARRAHKAAPEHPQFNDTLGWVLVNKGEPAEGLAYLRNAQSRLAGDPQISYHIAVALDALGRSSEALKELDIALQTGQSFDGLEEAQALRKRLSR